MPGVSFEDATRSTNISIYPYVIDLENLDEKRERKDTKIISSRTSAQCRFRIYSHKLIFLPDNINYVFWFVPIFPRSFIFPFIVVNIYSSANFPSSCFIAESYRPIAPVWYSNDRYCLPRNSMPDTSPRVTLRWRRKNERALGVVRDPFRAATVLHGLLIFISCNIYRGAIAVRRGKVASSERLRDIPLISCNNWNANHQRGKCTIEWPLRHIASAQSLSFLRWVKIKLSSHRYFSRYFSQIFDISLDFTRESNLEFITKERRDELIL